MQEIALIIILLAVVTALAEVTDKVMIPYPILLVMAGIGIGLFPDFLRSRLIPKSSSWFSFHLSSMRRHGKLVAGFQESKTPHYTSRDRVRDFHDLCCCMGCTYFHSTVGLAGSYSY